MKVRKPKIKGKSIQSRSLDQHHCDNQVYTSKTTDLCNLFNP